MIRLPLWIFKKLSVERQYKIMARRAIREFTKSLKFSETYGYGDFCDNYTLFGVCNFLRNQKEYLTPGVSRLFSYAEKSSRNKEEKCLFFTDPVANFIAKNNHIKCVLPGVLIKSESIKESLQLRIILLTFLYNNPTLFEK